MRATQFWILLLGSSFVSIFFIKLIFLSRALDREQRQLVDCQEIASTAPAFENAWKQLAIHVYQASPQDPALADVLKREGVEIHSKPGAGAGSAPPAMTPPPPPTSPSTPIAPIQPSGA